ncbi:hypothetical protein JVU11DRAFT_8177 [Chiua virens]|nr:hypothetical protein JVU11DRAFT_8177 [Chiua virens]
MPRKNKRKDKVGTNAQAGRSIDNLADASPHRCLTLEEDEMTRCDQLATEAYPDPNRCKVHHGQYHILYKKYKDAQQVVDDLQREVDLFAKVQIGCYTDWHSAFEKAQWVRMYLDAVRVEQRGREIHEKRFFLKVDDRHRDRLKLLEGEMIRAIDTFDALQKRACELYKGALPVMKDLALSKVEEEWEKESRRSTKELVEFARNPDVFIQGSLMIPPLIMLTEEGDEDLIDISFREQKEQMISILRSLNSIDSYIEVAAEKGSLEPQKTESMKALLEKEFFTHQQFARRIIFYEPSLFVESLEKTSLEDFFLSDDLSIENLARFLDMFLQPMGFPLKWFKDAVLDALAMSHHGTVANAGGVDGQIPLLGGCIFNHANTTTIPNEVWGFLLKILRPSADMESRFVCLCNNFEDLVGFLSFAALGLVPSPSFCQSRPQFDPNDPALSRNHLSLSGIIVADIVSHVPHPQLRGPFPTTLSPTRRGSAVWAEVQIRSYMFGAMRNERDGFLEAFIRELRARPDLFQVVLRSDTAPGRQVEMFGSGASNNEALPAIRGHQFEAPPWSAGSIPSVPPSLKDKWDVKWSALDVLYGSRDPGNSGLKSGYLSDTAQTDEGRFFRFKTFPVTYFVILDTVPHRDRSVLAKNVAWAALRAGGYAEGEYTVRKYAIAADKLVEKCIKERLEWVPEEMKWKIPRMQDQMTTTAYQQTTLFLGGFWGLLWLLWLLWI